MGTYSATAVGEYNPDDYYNHVVRNVVNQHNDLIKSVANTAAQSTPNMSNEPGQIADWLNQRRGATLPLSGIDGIIPDPADIDKFVSSGWYRGVNIADMQILHATGDTAEEALEHAPTGALETIIGKVNKNIAGVKPIMEGNAQRGYTTMLDDTVRLLQENPTMTPNQAVGIASKLFGEKGIAGFTTSAGHAWQADTYIGSQLNDGYRVAANQAMYSRFEERGYNYVKVSSSMKPCKRCTPYEDDVLYINESEPHELAVGSLTAAIAAGLQHTYCHHSCNLYIPNGTPVEPIIPAHLPASKGVRPAASQLAIMRKWERALAAAQGTRNTEAIAAVRACIRATNGRARNRGVKWNIPMQPLFPPAPKTYHGRPYTPPVRPPKPDAVTPVNVADNRDNHPFLSREQMDEIDARVAAETAAAETRATEPLVGAVDGSTVAAERTVFPRLNALQQVDQVAVLGRGVVETQNSRTLIETKRTLTELRDNGTITKSYWQRLLNNLGGNPNMIHTIRSTEGGPLSAMAKITNGSTNVTGYVYGIPQVSVGNQAALIREVIIRASDAGKGAVIKQMDRGVVFQLDARQVRLYRLELQDADRTIPRLRDRTGQPVTLQPMARTETTARTGTATVSDAEVNSALDSLSLPARPAPRPDPTANVITQASAPGRGQPVFSLDSQIAQANRQTSAAGQIDEPRWMTNSNTVGTRMQLDQLYMGMEYLDDAAGYVDDDISRIQWALKDATTDGSSRVLFTHSPDDLSRPPSIALVVDDGDRLYFKVLLDDTSDLLVAPEGRRRQTVAEIRMMMEAMKTAAEEGKAFTYISRDGKYRWNLSKEGTSAQRIPFVHGRPDYRATPNPNIGRAASKPQPQSTGPSTPAGTSWTSGTKAQQQDAIRSDFSRLYAEVEDAGSRSYLDKEVTIYGKQVEIEFNGGGINIQRNIDFRTGNIDHSYWKIPESIQSNGMATRVLKNSLPVYKAQGLKTVTVHANIKEGSYCWSGMGFKWNLVHYGPTHIRKIGLGDNGSELASFIQYRLSGIKTRLDNWHPTETREIALKESSLKDLAKAQLQFDKARKNMSLEGQDLIDAYPSAYELTQIGRPKWVKKGDKTMWAAKAEFFDKHWWGIINL